MSEKPVEAPLPSAAIRAVRQAVTLVWIWIVFLAVYGIYDSWVSVPKAQDALAQTQALLSQLDLPYSLSIGNNSLFELMAAGYVLADLTMVGTTLALGAGKKGARLVLAISFIIDLISTVSSPPDTLVDYAALPINIGLQAYALWLVYTKPGSLFFKTHK